MKPTLPVQLNFLQKAKSGLEIQGKMPLKHLKRLCEALLSDEGELEAELKFGKAGPIPYIQGHVTAELELKCQRCMQSMHYTVDNHFKLGLVLNDEHIEKLPDEYEPYQVEEDENSRLADMLEDELLLALPLVAKHDFECSEYVQSTDSEQHRKSEVDSSENKENPFASLKDLL